MKNKPILLRILLGIVVLIVIVHLYSYFFTITEQTIRDLTDRWCNDVIVKHDSDAISKLFCSDGNLIGTVSMVERKGQDIKLYFDYFANLPNITIVSKKYDISQIESDVFINTAFITWNWDGLAEPVTARMTFVFKNRCIFQLHSSVLPELNKGLLKVSNMP